MINNIGLVLEGGGMRGVFTLGVLDRLLDGGIVFKYVIGVSAGACNAASYVSGQRGRGMKIHDRFIDNKRYIDPAGMFSPRRSMFGMDFIFDEIPSLHVPYDFDALYGSGHEFVVGLTDANTGGAVYVHNPTRDRLNLCVRASSSIPLFSPIVRIGQQEYLDGGTADPIPFAHALETCDKVVVITTRPERYRKRSLPLPMLYQLMLSKYPRMAMCCMCRHEVYNRQILQLEDLEKQGIAFVIRPDSMHLDAFSRNRKALWEGYHAGEAKLSKVLPALLEFIQEVPSENKLL